MVASLFFDPKTVRNLTHVSDAVFKNVVLDLPESERRFISELTGCPYSFDNCHVVKRLPLYKARECHQNCYEYIQKNKDFGILRGWLLVPENNGQIGLTYHSIVWDMRNRRKYDITKVLIPEDNALNQMVFLLDHRYMEKAYTPLSGGRILIDKQGPFATDVIACLLVKKIGPDGKEFVDVESWNQEEINGERDKINKACQERGWK
jgi:hypothetical protein